MTNDPNRLSDQDPTEPVEVQHYGPAGRDLPRDGWQAAPAWSSRPPAPQLVAPRRGPGAAVIVALALVTGIVSGALSAVAVTNLFDEPVTPTGVVLDGPAADDVRAAEVAFARTMADRDFEAFLTFVAADAVFFAGNRPLRGRDAIGEAWRPFFEGPEAPFSWTPDVVQVLESGGVAFSSGPVTGASGEAAGRFNSVWRQEPDGTWRVIFDKGS